MSENRTTDVLVAFGIGLLVGGTAALLLAPASGAETRSRIGELAGDLGDKVRGASETTVDRVKHEASRVGTAFREGKEAYLRESKDA